MTKPTKRIRVRGDISGRPKSGTVILTERETRLLPTVADQALHPLSSLLLSLTCVMCWIVTVITELLRNRIKIGYTGVAQKRDGVGYQALRESNFRDNEMSQIMCYGRDIRPLPRVGSGNIGELLEGTVPTVTLQQWGTYPFI